LRRYQDQNIKSSRTQTSANAAYYEKKDGTIVILDVVNRQNAYASKEIFEMNKFKGKK